MRVVLQRVSRAEVRIDGHIAGRIGRGFLLLVGFSSADSHAESLEGAETAESRLQWMADKIVSLRLFPDPDGKMNLGLADVAGGILVVSQFTLYGDARKGRRPSFVDAARPEIAVPLYEKFVELLRSGFGGPVETGEFGAMMEVELVNDGPVTLLLER